MRDLVERGEATASLEELLAGAVGGRGAVAFVSGAVGVGKSALLHAFAEQAIDLGALAIGATGVPTERNLPLGVLRQLFHTAPLPPAERSRVTGLLDEAARSAVAAADTEVGPMDAQIMYALCTALIELSGRYPLAVVVDDAHLIDRASLVFTSYLARRVRYAPVLVVVASTECPDADVGPLGSEQLRWPYHTRVRLSPLGPDGVAAMAAAHVGPTTADRHAAAWHALSGGNTRLVAGLLDDHRTETGGGRPDPGEAVAGDGYGQAVVACLRRGGERVRAVGRGLAVLPEPDVVHRLLDTDPERAAQAVRALTAAGILHQGGYRHQVARAAVLADLDRTERAALHRRAARLAYGRGDPNRAVAEQLLPAGGCAEPWEVPVLEDAARQELRQDRVERAVALLELAARQCADERQRSRILMALVRAEWRINPSKPSGYLGQLAARLQQGHLCGDDAVVLAKALLWHGWFAEAKEVFTHLGRAAPHEQPTELVLARPWLGCTYPPLLPHLPPAPGAVPPAAMPTVAASQRLAAARALAGVLGGGEDGTVVTTMERIMRASHLDDTGIDTVECALLALVYGGHAEPAAAWCDRFLQQARSRRAPSRHARLSAVRAEAALRLGDLAQALHHARHALAIIPPTSWGVSVGGPLATLIEAATASGHHDEAAELLDQPVPEAMFDTRYGLPYLHARGQYSLASGHAALALRDFRRCGELMRAWRLDAPGLVAWRVGAAQAYLAAGRSDRAARLLSDQLDRCGDQPRVKGMALRGYAAAGLARHRPMLLREAADLLRRSGDRRELACTMWALGEAYEAVGEPRRASGIRARARGLADGCQAQLADASGQERSQSGRDHPEAAVPATGPAALSASEHRVAALAAAGYTNREIAKRLFVTVSTVEQHLTRIYRKLQITSRAELPSDLDAAEPAIA